MAQAAEMAFSRRQGYLYAKKSVLETLSRFKNSDVLAEKIQATKGELAHVIRVNENVRSLRTMGELRKLEEPNEKKLCDSGYDASYYAAVNLLRQNYDMHLEIGDLHQSRAKKLSGWKAHAENYMAGASYLRALRECLAVANMARITGDLHMEITEKENAMELLSGEGMQIVINKGMYLLLLDLQKEIPQLKKEQESKRNEYRPRRGN